MCKKTVLKIFAVERFPGGKVTRLSLVAGKNAFFPQFQLFESRGWLIRQSQVELVQQKWKILPRPGAAGQDQIAPSVVGRCTSIICRGPGQPAHWAILINEWSGVR
jgi:hypothetical protein